MSCDVITSPRQKLMRLSDLLNTLSVPEICLDNTTPS